MTVIPLLLGTTSPEDAIDWLSARGATTFRLWRGADGLIRGHGVRS